MKTAVTCLPYLAVAALITVVVLPSQDARTIRLKPQPGADGPQIQAALDKLRDGNGGTLVLAPGTYDDVAAVVPYDTALTGRKIRIVGYGATLAGGASSPDPVLWIGKGYANQDEQLDGIVIEGLSITHLNHHTPKDSLESNRKGIFLQGTVGALITRCSFVDCPLEAHYDAGVDSRIEYCTATNCGLNWGLGNLSGFNVNGLRARLTHCTAIKCGWGFESAATNGLISQCSFVDCTGNQIGSASWGLSGLVVSGCTFERSYLGMGNGIGRLENLSISGNVFRDCGVSWLGGRPDDAVVSKPPWFPAHTSGPTRVTGNTFTGASAFVSLNSWPYTGQVGSLIVESNRFGTAPNPIQVQANLDLNTVTIQDNWFPAVKVGTYYMHEPDSSPLPDPTPRITWARNRIADGGYVQKSNSIRVLVQ